MRVDCPDEKKFDIAGAWWSVTVDPDMFYNPLQHSTSAWNFTGFKSEEADRRLDAFRSTASAAARMRPLDILMAFPAILLAIALTSVFGTGVLLVSLALGIVYVPIVARVVRAAVLATKAEVYVEGARAVGATAPRLVLRHIVPNCVTPLLVQASVLMAIAILVEAALSFLGVGVRPPTPSLGLMLSDGRGFMLQAPWVVVFPGLAILTAVLGFNMLADGLRDWLDPQQGAARR